MIQRINHIIIKKNYQNAGPKFFWGDHTKSTKKSSEKHPSHEGSIFFYLSQKEIYKNNSTPEKKATSARKKQEKEKHWYPTTVIQRHNKNTTQHIKTKQKVATTTS